MTPPILAELAIAKRWLNKCYDSHNCGARNDVKLPTRLLDLRGLGNQLLRLVTPPRSAVGRYAALSYCWGLSVQFTTTRGNLEEFSRGFPPRLLPSTIRDAAVFTKGLGLRYLWVDALCIIQGSDDTARCDWELESARMPEVYGNAFVTIVASSARDCDEGMFFRRHLAATKYSPGFLLHTLNTTTGIPKASQDQKMKESWHELGGSLDTTAETQQTAAEKVLPQNTEDPTLRIRIPRKFRRKFGGESINSRAWALQERLLSPRLLIYTWDHIFWHCDESLEESENESSVLELGHGLYGYRLKDTRTVTNLDWEKIVESYCARSLTHGHDKLPALSGLAQRYHALSSKPDKYLAGLWESHLPRHLLWIHFDVYNSFLGKAKNQRPTEYHAPSWSWASIDGHVSFLHLREGKNPPHLVLRVVSSHVELENDNSPFGRVRGGSLVLRGQLRKAKRIEVSGPRILALEKSTGREFDLGGVFLDDESPQGLAQAQSLDSIFCLLVTTSPQYRSLLLTSVPGRQGVYSRIGISCSCSEKQRLWFKDAPVKTVTVI